MWLWRALGKNFSTTRVQYGNQVVCYGSQTLLINKKSNERTRGNGCKPKYRKLHLNLGKKIYGKTDQTLEQVAQRDCGNINPWIIQNLTGEGPGQPALAHPAVSRVMD